MQTFAILNFSCVAQADEVSMGQLQNFVAEILSQPKVGVSICEHESKVEVDGTNGDKGVNGVEINKGNAETVEVVQAWRF